MKEQKDFIEPVVLVRIPFRMVQEVAREAAARTHELVMRLTGSEQGSAAHLGPDSHPAAVPSR